MTDEVIKVYPAHPERYPDEYVAGVGIDGTELPADEAQALLEAGVVLRNRSRRKAATQEEPEAGPESEPAPTADEPTPEGTEE